MTTTDVYMEILEDYSYLNFVLWAATDYRLGSYNQTALIVIWLFPQSSKW